jgi:hypothetical protein
MCSWVRKNDDRFGSMDFNSSWMSVASARWKFF